MKVKDVAKQIIEAKEQGGPASANKAINAFVDDMIDDLKASITPKTKPETCLAQMREMDNRWRSLVARLASEGIVLDPNAMRRMITEKDQDIARLMGWL